MAKESLVIGLILIFIAPSSLLEAGCGHYFHHKVVAVPVVAAVPIYQVGTDLEIKAAVEKALREREQAAARNAPVRQTQHENWKQERQPDNYQTRQGFAALAPTLYAKCGKCHAEGNFSAGGSYDMSKGLNSEQFFRITDMVANKTDVPGIMRPVIEGLKPEEYGKILDELIRVKKATGSPVVSNSVVPGY